MVVFSWQGLNFVVLALFAMQQCGFSFEITNPFGGPPKPKAGGKSPNIRQTKKQLIEAVSNTNNGKSATPEQQSRVLELVQSLEATAPAPNNILLDPAQAQKIDGIWYLQYTSPSKVGDPDKFPNAWKPDNPKEGESQIDTQAFNAQGNVRAAGIVVDTSNRVVEQIFDVANQRVQNKVDLGWGRVEVEGFFRPSDSVPNRAIVGFDRAEIFLNDDKVVVRLSWVFNRILPLLKNGSRDNGWIETTFIDDEMRIARGNLGTLFVITRDVDAVQP